ncbi:dTDP-4-dehydrorhamnose reductase [Nonlabens marinus]|uniref:dTDP-4-dehydrorhamnose reductase n=1 Tax=Nonlabens marinus S1-08 TaxID=1454201 RepID=W8VQ51_9FLAO|nr:dTDP-4-dehydrorhamnose reductase [Nonlabens marinus]BAO54855.1 dTDP-4-dehydrorhamnose reductase [Nonlabens marinus S1-08]
MKKILIVGAGGMLGTSIATAFQDSNTICLDRNDLDITCYSKVRHQLYKHRPEYVINCAAYTAVDQAESEPLEAFKINASAVGMLAALVKQVGATLIHFSTDYVFDGTAVSPYKPTDLTNPLNTYGSSKLQGEQAIQRTGVKHYIFRISWLYAPHGKNFFRWVMENDLEEMKVVDNQTGCPTSAVDLADFITHVVYKDPEHYGIYHFCNKGSMTWFAFAKAILAHAGLQRKITPVSEFPTVAKRPEYSVLDSSMTEVQFGYEITRVSEAIEKTFTAYTEQL